MLRNPASTAEGRARSLLVHSGDYEEWGVSGLVRIDPGASGRGLSVSAQPAWDETASGVRRLWETGVAGGAAPAYRAGATISQRTASAGSIVRSGPRRISPS